VRRILTAALALTLLASGHAQQGDATTETVVSAPSRTLTCQVAAPTWAGLCYVEATVALLGPLEVLVGVEGRAALSGDFTGSVAGYVTLAWWDAWGGAWVDVRLPELVPPLGVSDWLRAGFSYRFN